MGPRPPDHTSDRNSDDTSDHTSDRTSDRFSDLSTDAATDFKPTSKRSAHRTPRVRHVLQTYVIVGTHRALPLVPSHQTSETHGTCVRVHQSYMHAIPKPGAPTGGRRIKTQLRTLRTPTLSTPNGPLQTREVVARPSRRAVACSTTPPSSRQEVKGRRPIPVWGGGGGG